MTDITDQDRRTAHEWAASIDPEMDCWSASARAVARVILATVDAPATTLAEELRSWAEDASYDEDRDNLLHAATRAAQMEHDLTEARAEAEQAEDRAAEWQSIAQLDYVKVELLTAERDEARAEVTALAEDLAGAESEVERLTAVNEELRHTDNYREFKEFLGVQKGAESNAETPNPADVPPGEAWIVECRGERRTAVKDNGIDIPWNTVSASGWFDLEDSEDITLITRLVPAPRVITDHDGLNLAKRNTVIRDNFGVVCERAALGDGWFTTGNGVDQTPYIQFPATVLWEPGV